MNTLGALLNQRNVIQAEIDRIQRENRAARIAEVQELMKTHGISTSDLKTPGNRVVPVKYRGPGGTWTGRGKMPTWLRDAVAAGAPLASFRVA